MSDSEQFDTYELALARVPLSLDLMTNSYKLAERINSDVNARVTYKSDLEQYGTPEHWCFTTTNFGDCEDYALPNVKLLLNKGGQRQNRFMRVVYPQAKVIVYYGLIQTKVVLF